MAGIGVCLGSPACGCRPLVMISIRKLGSRVFGTPGNFSMGLSTAPIPPSKLEPWQVAQFCAYRVAPLSGSPGSAVAPLAVEPAEGDGEVSARVEMPVRMKKAGIPSARRRPLLTRI